MSKRRILFVDDEQSILQLLTRMCAPLQDAWDVDSANSGEEALQKITENPFDVVVSDLNMPGIDGAGLMDHIARHYPETARFIFSGTPSREGILKLVKTTHQFLQKPDDLREIRALINRASMLQELLPSGHLQRIVSQVTTLPSLPDLYLQIMQELRSDNCSVKRVGEIIEQDLSMSAKILQLVNSAFFGLREHVSSPAQAAGLLGLDIIKSLVLMVNIFSELQHLELNGFSARKLWDHSLNTGVIGRDIAEQEALASDLADQALMGGLFHDLGKLLLAINMPQDYLKAMRMTHREHISLVEAEQRVLGASHAEVGAYLLGLWGFSDTVIQTAAYHHNPGEYTGEFSDVMAIIHVANVWEHDESGTAEPGVSLDEAYLAKAGLTDRLEKWQSLCRYHTQQDHS